MHLPTKISLNQSKYLILFVLLSSFLVIPSIAKSDPTEIIQRNEELIKFLQNMHSMTANFTQEETDEEFFGSDIKKGRFYISKPQKARWIYEQPDIEWFLLLKTRLYHYEKDLNQVTIAHIDANSNDIPIKWLIDDHDLEKTFKIKHLGRDVTGNWFELKPISNLSFNRIKVRLHNSVIDYFEIYTGIDKIVKLHLQDVEYNKPIDEDIYKFVTPEGAELL